VLQSVGILAGLLTTAYTIRKDSEVRRIETLFTLTKGHREIWSELLDRPELARVLSAEVVLEEGPITEVERRFVLFLILHAATSYEATKYGTNFAEPSVQRDLRNFFRLPIPEAVWKEFKAYQPPDFVEFVEAAIADDSI
jgi:hypothetical protein